MGTYSAEEPRDPSSESLATRASAQALAANSFRLQQSSQVRQCLTGDELCPIEWMEQTKQCANATEHLKQLCM